MNTKTYDDCKGDNKLLDDSYKIFESLLARDNVSSYKVAKETGIASATLSDWKKGKSKPKNDKLQKIAEYFNVTIDFLINGKENNVILTAKDENDISKKLQDTLSQLESSDGLMFDGEPLDESTKELLKVGLENAIRTAKITAKQKFTPKKYK